MSVLPTRLNPMVTSVLKQFFRELKEEPGALPAEWLRETPMGPHRDAMVDMVDGTVIKCGAGTSIFVVVELHY